MSTVKEVYEAYEKGCIENCRICKLNIENSCLLHAMEKQEQIWKEERKKHV